MARGEMGLRRIDADAGAPSPDGTADVFSRLVKVDNVQVAGSGIKSPMATLLVGGWAMQFLLFAVTASATALFREKEQGIFQRLLSAPVTRGDILWSKFLYGICLGLLQLVVLFFAGACPLRDRDRFPARAPGPRLRVRGRSLHVLRDADRRGVPHARIRRGLSTFVILLMCAIGGAGSR